MTRTPIPTGPEQAPEPIRIQVAQPSDLDAAAVRAVANGAGIDLAPTLVAHIAEQRAAALAILEQGPEVYGVTTGMGALSGVRLSPEQQSEHSARLMLGRAVGGEPWLERAEARAAVATRLRSFLGGEAAVSAELCAWLATLLDHDDLVAQIPRSGSGAAGEILPLAHAWEHLSGVGERAARARELGAVRLGPKEGLALLAGTPIAAALAILRAGDGRQLATQSAFVAAASMALVQASRDPLEAATARGDDILAAVLTDIRNLAGSAAEVADTPVAPHHLQAPVSFRVAGPSLAYLHRALDRLDDAAERALSTVGDSPALLPTDSGLRFVGTAGFHGIELAATFDAARVALLHCAYVSLARLHRMLDAQVSGLAPQLSAAPGPMAGLTPLHKWAAGRLHEVTGAAMSAVTMETSHGQEDVQSFALASAERMLNAVEVSRQVLACELLAVHQARRLAPDRLNPLIAGHADLSVALDAIASRLPEGTEDRPWGRDIAVIASVLKDGWAGSPRNWA